MSSILHLNFPRVTRLWGDCQARFFLAATVLTSLILPQTLLIDANLKNPWGLVQSATSFCGLLMLGAVLRRRTTGIKLGLGRESVSES